MKKPQLGKVEAFAIIFEAIRSRALLTESQIWRFSNLVSALGFSMTYRYKTKSAKTLYRF